MLDEAFVALETYDWGTDRNLLQPINQAVMSTYGDASAREALEARLAAVLPTDVSRDAKDFVCRKLTVIGTAASVPALAALLPEEDNSHMARYALERIPAPEAAQAMRDALPKVDNSLKVGIISSLGVRKDEASVPLLIGLLDDSDASVARSAALALGDIGSKSAAKALASSDASGENLAATDALLATAEGLLAAGQKADALAIYKGLAKTSKSKNARLAATRGVLACAGK